jgi:predicted RNase H-related nuclease YkuK (DUF458 family)
VRAVKEFNMEEVKEKIRNSSPETSVYIGCDSQVKAFNIEYVLVVVIHFDTKHGAKVFYSKYKDDFYGKKIKDKRQNKEDQLKIMRMRLWKEVELSSLLALELVEVIGERNLQVHLDLNSDKQHKSSTIIAEAMSYITALGFECKNKPDSWAATYAADHILKS